MGFIDPPDLGLVMPCVGFGPRAPDFRIEIRVPNSVFGLIFRFQASGFGAKVPATRIYRDIQEAFKGHGSELGYWVQGKS